MIDISCKACQKIFRVRPYRKDKAKFCSRECLNHIQYEKYELICKGCDKPFEVSGSRKDKSFCSLDCKSIKAKTTKERRKQQKAAKIRSRGHIKGRNLKANLSLIKPIECESCGYNLHSFCIDVHHKDENPNNNNINNLALLCAMCHRMLHKGLVALEGGSIAINSISL
jgi:hypothetical protein